MPKYQEFNRSLSPVRSFLRGYASAFDCLHGGGRVAAPDSFGGPEQDAAALAGDWAQVGQDLRRAMNQVAANG